MKKPRRRVRLRSHPSAHRPTLALMFAAVDCCWQSCYHRAPSSEDQITLRRETSVMVSHRLATMCCSEWWVAFVGGRCFWVNGVGQDVLDRLNGLAIDGQLGVQLAAGPGERGGLPEEVDHDCFSLLHDIAAAVCGCLPMRVLRCFVRRTQAARDWCAFRVASEHLNISRHPPLQHLVRTRANRSLLDGFKGQSA
eukprot:scaffold38275_cov33-Tisochrysis_lutea.AAC.2